jgi:CBS domain containing-hemolysin-like protein
MSLTINRIALFAPIAPGEAVEGSVGGLIVFILVALGVSFLCSVWEAVILSTSMSHVQIQVENKKRSGRLMEKHKQNVERPISAILTLNTIAHTVGAAGAGAQAAAVFGNEWLGLISAILTLLILVFSEIIPKTLGAVYWKQLNPFTAYSVALLIWALYPAVWAFQVLTNLIAKEDMGPTVTLAELQMLAQISTQEGALREKDSRILGNLLRLNQVQIDAIMTPRTVLLAFQQDKTIRDVIEEHRALPYSRIPIYEENTDSIVGVVLRHEVFRRAANDEYDVPLKALKRPIHPVPETITVAQALDEFITRQQHMFLVIDEYGGTAGILTMEDALESLLGAEITDESDLVADLRKLAQQRYQGQLDERIASSE